MSIYKSKHQCDFEKRWAASGSLRKEAFVNAVTYFLLGREYLTKVKINKETPTVGKNFVDLFLAHTKEFESPSSFWTFSAYATVAATLRDNVYLPDGDNKLFANLYILFLAGSGARKNRPVNLAEELLVKVANTKVISGRASIQGILDELARTETNASTGKMVKGGSAIFFAPELSSGIVESTEAISILTDIYDGKTNFSSVLRHSPKFRVDRIVFSALMATNEEMSKSFIDTRATQGGFLARTLLIIPNEFREGNPLMRWTQGDEDRRAERMENLLTFLREIATLKGQMTYSGGAREEHTDWYIPFRKSYLQKGDKAGIAGRLHTHVKKLSMVLAANQMSMEIERSHMEEAINICMGLIPNYNMFIMTTGKSQVAEAGGIIIKDLAEAKGNRLSRKELLRRHWQDFDEEVFTKLMNTLTEAGWVESILVGNTMEFKLSDKMLERIQGKIEERSRGMGGGLVQ